MWALYTRTVKDHRISWLTYGVIALLFLVLYMAVFPSIQGQAATYDQIMKSMPKAVLDAFGITQAAPTLMGFLASKHFGFVWPLMVIMLMAAFAGSASRSVEQRTVGLLLSLPISRFRIYWTRVLAGITGLSIFTIVSIVAVWPLALAFNYDVDIAQVWLMGELGMLFGVAVLGLSMLLAASIDESGKLYSAVGGILLLMYVGNLIAGLEPSLAVIKYASVFHYFVPGDVVSGGGLDTTTVAAFSGLAAVTLLAGALVAKRRDLSV